MITQLVLSDSEVYTYLMQLRKYALASESISISGVRSTFREQNEWSRPLPGIGSPWTYIEHQYLTLKHESSQSGNTFFSSYIETRKILEDFFSIFFLFF